MNILYTVMFLVLFVVCFSLYVLYRMTVADIKDLENENRLQAEELKRINNKLARHEVRINTMKAEKNKIEIVHKYDDSDAPDFPNSRRY